MKKRILSMLLLVAMVVTALPLFALPTLAATETEAKTYEEADYNALYVSDGLAIGADFFKMNKYWNPEGEGHVDYAVPLAPIQKTSTTVDGVEYNFSDADVRAANQQAYIDAVVAWKTEYKDFMNTFTWTTGSMKFGVFQDYSKGADIYKYADRFTTDIYAADGYMQFLSDYYASGGVVFSGLNGTDLSTGQYVASYTDAGVGKTQVPFLFHNVRPRLTATQADGVKLAGFSTSYFGGSTYTDETDFVAPLNQPFTLTQSLALSSAAGEDKFTLRVGTATLVDLKGDYGKETLDNGNHYIGWGAVQPWLRLYAYRHYNRVLSDPEIAQNHFADIAKWFRIDLSVLDVLGAADLPVVAAAFKDFTFDSDKAAVEAALLAKVTEVVSEKYAGTDAAAYAALATKHGLDLSPLLSNPKGMLSHTYAFLNGITDVSVNVKAGYEAALALDLASSLTVEDYNKLFVSDGLLMGFDFYETNEYWTNTPVTLTGTTNAAAKELIHSYRYADGLSFTVTLKKPTSYGSLDLSIKDGYLDLSTMEYLYPNGLHEATNHAENSLTVELVRNLTTKHLLLGALSLRVRADATTGELTSMVNASADIGLGTIAKINAANALGVKKFTNMHSAATYTAVIRSEPITEKSPELDYKDSLDTVLHNEANNPVYYYLTQDVYNIETAENGDVTVDLGSTIYTLANEGKDISDMRYEKDGEIQTIRAIEMRTYPCRPVTPKYIKDAEGNVTENTAGTTYWTALNRLVGGEAHIWQNGNKVYENENQPWINTTYYYNEHGYIVVWGEGGRAAVDAGFEASKLYGGRYYSRALTEDEIAQNHFADIAKFFKLNIVGFDALDADGKAAVYAAVADATFDSDRTAVQNAVNTVLNAVAKDTYDALKAAHPEVPAAFFDLAYEYRLNLDTVLSSARDMSSVYLTTFTGLSCADAQARLDEAYLDAYTFLSYQLAGETAYNAMLAWCAANMDGNARVDLEGLMALPIADRLGITAHAEELQGAESVVAAQGMIDAYVAVKMEKYKRAGEAYDYSSLYAAQDAALISLDFFKTNEYWNETVDPLTACEQIDGYEYNGKTYNFKSNPADRFYAADEKWAVLRSDGNYVYYTKTGGLEATKCNYPNAPADATIPGQVTMPRQAFATEAEAKALEAAAKAKWSQFTYKIVEMPLFIVYRELVSNGARWAYAEKKVDGEIVTAWDTAKATIAYDTMELATAKAAELAGEGATEADGVYTDANGVYKYYAALRPIVSAEYQQCINDYANASVKLFNSFESHELAAGITPISLNQNMTSIGELGYQDRNGEHMYTQMVYENGYAMLNSHHSGPYFSVTKIPTAAESTVYFDTLMAGGDKNAKSTKVITFQGANLLFTINDAGTTLSSVGGKDVGLTAAGRNTPFRLEISSTATASNAATFKITLNSDAETKKTVDVATTTQSLIGHSQASAARIYTYRIYNRILTPAEQAQNAFADLAKWYKLDLTLYETLSDEERAKVWADMEGWRIDDADRIEVQNALNASVASYAYAGVVIFEQDAEKNDKFMVLAATGAIDLAPIKMLAPAAREAFAESVLLADFDPAYATNADVIYTVYNNATFNLSAMTFAGYQVRLDTGAALANYAGVRAVFDIDEARIAEIIEKNDGAAVTVAFSVTGDATETISFVYTLVEGELVCTTDAVIYDRDGKRSVNYTVTFKGEEYTKELLEAEVSYGYSIQVGDAAAIEFAVNTATFGDKVSAAEVYSYFYANGLAEDRMVADVMAKLAD